MIHYLLRGVVVVADDPAIARHLQDESWENSVINITKTVLQKAQDDQMTPGQAANELADHYCTVEHPIWGHRSQQIINSLLRGQCSLLP